MGTKDKKRKEKKEAQRAEQARQVQLDQLLKQAKDFIKHKCEEAIQAHNINELKLWNQRLNDSSLIHIQAMKIVARNGSFSELENLYQEFSRKYPFNIIAMRTCLLTKIDTSFSLEQTKTVLNAIEINLSEIPPIPVDSGNNKPVSRKITPILMQLVHQTWKQDEPDSQTKAKELLELFISKQLPLNETDLQNNALLRCITQYEQDVQFIEMLLESKHFNVNTVIIPTKTTELHDKEIYARTPFSLAFSYQNIPLVKILLKHGADPYLAGKQSIKTIKRHNCAAEHPKTTDTVMIGHKLGLEKLSPKAQQDYYVQIDKIIKEFFLRKIENTLTILLEQEEKAQAKKAAALLKKESATAKEDNTSTKFTQKETPAQKLASKGAPADAEATATESPESQISASDILDQYIDSQEQSTRNLQLPKEIREGHKFDSLVLRYIQTRDDSVLTEISAFLSEEHSAKNSNYYITVLTELGTSIEDASTILASMPKLLHKFCTVQKEIQTSASSATEQDEQNFGDDVYHIEGTKIFLQVDPELMSALPGNYKAKIHTQLSNPKFIAKNSFGISGVKDYGLNISKLKIAQTDENLVSTIRYKDSNGNLLIIFNQFLSHQETEALKQGTCIQVEGIQEIIHSTITKETSLATESVSHDTDSLLADSSTRCDDDLDQVALSGEDC